MDLSKARRNDTPREVAQPIATPKAAAAVSIKQQPAQPAITWPTKATPMDTLAQIIEGAIKVAYSKALPDDAPGVQRSLTNRRRHYVQLAALSFVNHDRKIQGDPEAAVEAMQMVAEALAAYDLKQRERVAPAQQPQPDPRTYASVIPPARHRTADAAPVAASPTVHHDGTTYKVTFVTKVAEATMRALYDADPRLKFEDQDLIDDPRLAAAARHFLAVWRPAGGQGDDFMRSVQQKADAATLPMLRGVLNVWFSGLKRTLRAANKGG